MRKLHPDVAGGDFLERVRFIENNEVVGKKKPTSAVIRIVHRIEQGEKKRMVQDNHLRIGDTTAKRLIETSRSRPTRLGRAKVLLTADLFPNGRIGLLQKITQRTVFCF